MKLISILMFLIGSPISLWADSTLKNLSNNNSPTATDLFYQVSGNTDYNVTLEQLTNITLSSITVTNPILYTIGATGALSLAPISLSTGVTGTLQAGQFPALTGDVTTAGGSLATTAAAVQSHITTFSSPITDTSSHTITGGGGLITTYGINIATAVITSLSASLPVHTDSNKNLITGTIANGDMTNGAFSNITGEGAQSQILNMNSHQISNVTDPTHAQDAATENYVNNSTATVQANGTNVTTQNPINFQNSSAVDGVTLNVSNPSAGNITFTYSGTLTVPGGGTGDTTITAHGLVTGEGTSALTATPAMDVGGLVIGSGTGVDPSTGTLTAGPNQQITNAAGSIILNPLMMSVANGLVVTTGTIVDYVDISTVGIFAGLSQSSGTVILGYVPPGKVWMMDKMYSFNPGLANETVAYQAIIGGVVMPVSSSGVVTSTAGLNLSNFDMVLPTGATIQAVINSTGIAIYPQVLEMTDTGHLKTVFLTSLSAGDNTLYTVPAGKSAIAWMAADPSAISPCKTSNQSGSTVTRSIKTIMKDGSNQIVVNYGSVATNTLNSQDIPTTYAAGDKILINSNTSCTYCGAWVTILELP